MFSYPGMFYSNDICSIFTFFFFKQRNRGIVRQSVNFFFFFLFCLDITISVSHCLLLLHLGCDASLLGLGSCVPWAVSIVAAVLGDLFEMPLALLFRRSRGWWIRPGHPHGGGKTLKRCGSAITVFPSWRLVSALIHTGPQTLIHNPKVIKALKPQNVCITHAVTNPSIYCDEL